MEAEFVRFSLARFRVLTGAIAPALVLFVINGYLFWRALTAH